MSYNNMLRSVVEKTLQLAEQYPEQDLSMFSTDPYRWGTWDWGAGVALYGVLAANEILDDSHIAIRVKHWIDARIHINTRKLCVNTTAPLSTVLRLGAMYDDPIYQETCRKYDRYLLHEIQRASNGAINHTTVKKENPGLVWADTLFMSIIYLSRRGAFLQDNTYLDEALKQLQAHVNVLYDETSGLFYHGWSDYEKTWLGVKWGRGNAWITAGIIDILQNIPEDSQAKQDTLSILAQQLSALKKYQDSDGFWRTVIDEAWTYQETTVTAGVAYGILKGIRLGLVDPAHRDMAEKALQAVLTEIDQHGVMNRASGGTPVKEDASAYNAIAFNVSPYSQGLALMALSEATMSAR